MKSQQTHHRKITSGDGPRWTQISHSDEEILPAEDPTWAASTALLRRLESSPKHSWRIIEKVSSVSVFGTFLFIL